MEEGIYPNAHRDASYSLCVCVCVCVCAHMQIVHTVIYAPCLLSPPARARPTLPLLGPFARTLHADVCPFHAIPCHSSIETYGPGTLLSLATSTHQIGWEITPISPVFTQYSEGRAGFDHK